MCHVPGPTIVCLCNASPTLCTDKGNVPDRTTSNCCESMRAVHYISNYYEVADGDLKLVKC